MCSLRGFVAPSLTQGEIPLSAKADSPLSHNLWSNEKAAAEAGVSNPTIIDLKKGRYEKKTIASVMKVAAALGLSMRDLFNDTQPQPAHTNKASSRPQTSSASALDESPLV
ncbi:MAG: hypothetical protein U0Y68_23920 [Blastocatellia bacterium]